MFAVAIDGPAGAGKSSVAKAAAQELGFVYVDTGALYRTVALYLLDHGVDPADRAAVEAELPKIEVGLKHTPEGQKMYLCGRDVTGEIRTPEVSMATSTCSAIPAVRSFLLQLQRDLAEKNNVLMDGRDIGTVVLPHAQLKIFLTASPEERARRRVRQLEEAGQKVEYESILKDIQQRDYQDSHRAAAPLRPAEDSVLLDTTGDTFEESVAKLEGLVRARL
ncbi:(d)CMP kinase [Neglectibacter timonensis]|uniref:Cytidylate kinase n=2 Tax=Neglectibacter timonensis TaxID=1776382 RepID=A0ABT1S1W9_9FIRM|nr:(d)CMP kinase [Neglectibacter timonensis]MCQ4840540.1 (d)CMP kinase [Neglectibacter timonensis]MCQ4844037.1 (d)CMP kinase [Neglectibacter timonensis]